LGAAALSIAGATEALIARLRARQSGLASGNNQIGV